MRETLDILSDPESARELLFSGRDEGEDYVAPAGATPGEILSELRSRQEQEQPATGAVALSEAMTSAKQAQAAAAEARRAADSARRSAVQAGAKAGHQRRSRAFRNVESGAARLRARREGGKTATDE
jgi:hypothetical protein